MYPDPDPRADQFNEAMERRRDGDEINIDDPELRDLLQLADRLDQHLPDDLPDPAFRANLKQKLLAPADGEQVPVDLARESWHRRLAHSTWRLSAAAAAFAVVILVAIVLGMGPLSGDDGSDSDQPVSIQDAPDDSADQEESELDVFDSAETFEADGPSTQEQEWVSANVPPFDTRHVVLNPLLGMPLGLPPPQIDPTVQVDPDAEMTDMPETAIVYYLSAPPDPEAHLIAVQQSLGLDGELVPGTTEGSTPYRIVDDSGETVIKWDHDSAFLHYFGHEADAEYEDFSDQGDDPAGIAQHFLETIGFDLYSIDYDVEVDEPGDSTTVYFEPSSLPETGLDLSLGASVTIDDGRVSEAMIMWFSLAGEREANLRPTGEAWDLAELGEGFWPPHEAPDGRVIVQLVETEMVYLLTRYDEDTYVLQPAVKCTGRYESVDDDDTSGTVEYYVPAIDKKD